MEQSKTFHQDLKYKMDVYVHFVYSLTKKFPKEEMFGVVSQLRRSAMSVILNYIEGYTRGVGRDYKHFLVISYGSLQESKYLLDFSCREKYILENDYKSALKFADEIGAMVWSTIQKMKLK